jgi:hypothetical protein
MNQEKDKGADKPPKESAGGRCVHLTYIALHLRGSRDRYDTESIPEAVSEAVAKWYAGSGEKERRPHIFSILVEPDDMTMAPEEQVEQYRDISKMLNSFDRHCPVEGSTV